MQALELIGTLTGLVYLYFEYRASIWLWAASIVMPAIYIFVYYDAGFYADMGINVYYLLASGYGWALWMRRGRRNRRLAAEAVGRDDARGGAPAWSRSSNSGGTVAGGDGTTPEAAAPIRRRKRNDNPKPKDKRGANCQTEAGCQTGKTCETLADQSAEADRNAAQNDTGKRGREAHADCKTRSDCETTAAVFKQMPGDKRTAQDREAHADCKTRSDCETTAAVFKQMPGDKRAAQDQESRNAEAAADDPAATSKREPNRPEQPAHLLETESLGDWNRREKSDCKTGPDGGKGSQDEKTGGGKTTSTDQAKPDSRKEAGYVIKTDRTAESEHTNAARPISAMPTTRWLPLGAIAAALFGAIAFVLIRFTDSTVPYGDSFTTALSIVGMWMLAQKYVEQWLVWIAVDVVCAGLYFYKGLYPTACLYALYTVIAVFGYFKWLRMMKNENDYA